MYSYFKPMNHDVKRTPKTEARKDDNKKKTLKNRRSMLQI